MSDDLQTLVGDDELVAPARFDPPPEPRERPRRPSAPSRPPQPRRGLLRRRRGRRGKPRLRKLRFLAILTGLGTLAFISTLFGMMMAVASDIPQLNYQRYAHIGSVSELLDYQGQPLGIFAPPTNQVEVKFNDISPYMRRAVVAVEDQRFWTEPGVDIKGIARAFVVDVFGHGHQGGSTITEQFVKNALGEQNNRTVLEKVREAALAYHLSRRWHKEKILSSYLNTVYFGNGAYGIESAARVYFGQQLGYHPTATAGPTVDSSTTPPRCGDFYYQQYFDASGNAKYRKVQLPKCAEFLQPWQAAVLAGMIANPSGFDPIQRRAAATYRRNLVLQDMLTRGPIPLSQAKLNYARRQPLPTEASILQPSQPTAAPYFTSWIAPQVVSALENAGVPAKYAPYRAYFGGLKIKTTLDLHLQHAADQAIAQNLPYNGPGSPVASLVAIDNQTGQVRAMVGGPINPSTGQEEYSTYPFNLATQGRRQPGSAFKPFTLAVALEAGYNASTVLQSVPFTYHFKDYKGFWENFKIRNFNNSYNGLIALPAATAYSDNSAFAHLGLLMLNPPRHCYGLACGYGGTDAIMAMAHHMGIRTPISNNPAMILGGLTIGVSPLDMAHAYETIAHGGCKVYDQVLGAPHHGPTGLANIVGGGLNLADSSYRTCYQVLPRGIAKQETSLLTGPVDYGTATNAQIPGILVAGKTGTTTNYGDAWFIGWTPQMTVAVWVGVADRLASMATAYQGGPVEGGTYPAIIWHDFMAQALQILATENPPKSGQSTTGLTTSTPGSAGSSAGGQSSNTSSSSQTSTAPPAGNAGTTGGSGAGGNTGGGGGGNPGGNGGNNPGGGNGGGNPGGGNPGGNGGGGSSSGGAGLGGGGSGG
jgi:penicillin-binding protein 1A